MNFAHALAGTLRHLPPRGARMAAIEVLLAGPAALGNDTLESGL